MNHPSFLHIPALTEALGAYAPALAVTLYDTIDSTNTAAKAETAAKADALEAASPALYIARTQTGGRGRLGRSFHSPADTGLYMTVAYTTERPLTEAVRVTAGAAVAAPGILLHLLTHTGK
jgi:BirA family biotin operon repressor/biotin-[acetyl-CoA-carboxylase] ligase